MGTASASWSAFSSPSVHDDHCHARIVVTCRVLILKLNRVAPATNKSPRHGLPRLLYVRNVLPPDIVRLGQEEHRRMARIPTREQRIHYLYNRTKAGVIFPGGLCHRKSMLGHFFIGWLVSRLLLCLACEVHEALCGSVIIGPVSTDRDQPLSTSNTSTSNPFLCLYLFML
jgi:hypothetical protein